MTFLPLIVFSLGCIDLWPPRQPSFASVRSSPAAFNLEESTRYAYEILRIAGDGGNKLLLGYHKLDRSSGISLGHFFRISDDGGVNFGPERMLPRIGDHVAEIRFLSFHLTPSVVTALYTIWGQPSNLLVLRSDDAGTSWSSPVQINDEELSFTGAASMVQLNNQDAYVIWTDRRRGFDLLFFSASHDGGLSWSPNRPVEYDFREGPQRNPVLVAGEKGRLVALWDDHRDRTTLTDIRCAYSDDQGRHWSRSQKLNDDDEPAWQLLDGAVARGRQIHVIFTDYRDRTEDGDRDRNIYYTRSRDNGQTWAKNVRVNDVTGGVDDFPILSLSHRGIPICVWRSCRYSIFGHLFLSFLDPALGEWAPSRPVADTEELAFSRPNQMVVLNQDRMLMTWAKILPGRSYEQTTWLEPTPTPANRPALDVEHSPRVPTPIASPGIGELIFHDDFTELDRTAWKTVSGTWMHVDGTLMGANPGVLGPYRLRVLVKEPERFQLRGRFRLDPLNHQMAYLYFREDETTGRYYVICNGFRNGACLSLKENQTEPLFISGFYLDGRPFAQGRFPFQRDRWYTFTLTVTPEQVQYAIDDAVLFTFEGQLDLPPGAIGIGGFGSAPTYFDDIKIYALP